MGNSWVPYSYLPHQNSGPSIALKMIVPSTAEEKICKKNDVNVIAKSFCSWYCHNEQANVPSTISNWQPPRLNTAITDSTASFSDALFMLFLSTQPQGSQLVHEDLEQLHDDDLEEMDLKWNMALLSMRARKGTFARECRAPRSKDNRNWNQGSSSKAVRIEDASEKAMCAIDGAGFDWSDMAEDEIQANMALMAFTDSEVSNDKSCSKSCLQNYEALKKQYDDLLVKLDDTAFKASTYKRGLSILEGQIIKYKESEVLFSEEIALLKRSVGHKEYLMGLLKTELEKVKEEKEGFEFKIAKFEKSSKDLDQLLASQITDKSKRGFGYNVVPSPHPLILNRPTPLDLSYSGLQEFKQPEVNEYGLRDSSVMPITGCDKESDNSKENTDDSLKQQQKTDSSLVKSPLKEEEPKKVRGIMMLLIIEDWVSDDERRRVSLSKGRKVETAILCYKKDCPKHMVPRAVLMKTGLKTINNSRPVNTVRSVNTARPFSTAKTFNTVRTSYTTHPKSTVLCARLRTYFQNQAQSTVSKANVNTGQAKGFNAVKPSACWVWRPIKPNGASLSNSQLNDKGFVDSGCSRHMSGNIAHLSDFKDIDRGTFSNDFAVVLRSFWSLVISHKFKIIKMYCHLANLEGSFPYFDDNYHPVSLRVNYRSKWTHDECSLQNNVLLFTMKNQSVSKALRILRGGRAMQENSYSSKLQKVGVLLTYLKMTLFLVLPRKELWLFEFEKLMKDKLSRWFYGLPSTPTDLEKPLVQDGDADDVDEHLYRSMIGSLMYLTASRPDIMFVSLGNRLISWQCKKQTKAEYVAVASCCRQRHQLQQHTRTYPVPSLSMKVFNNMKRPTKPFSGQEVALFPTMLVVTTPSTSPSRITSSPSHSPEHSPSPTPSTSPKPTPDHTTADIILSDDEGLKIDSSKQGRKLLLRGFKKKARWRFYQILSYGCEAMERESKSPEKEKSPEKSPEKIVEEDVDT
ncbi:hypothetical protein Tco_0970468 [Tanacetum coccineum]